MCGLGFIHTAMLQNFIHTIMLQNLLDLCFLGENLRNVSKLPMDVSKCKNTCLCIITSAPEGFTPPHDQAIFCGLALRYFN